jgi:hypothetical protein
MTDKIIIDGVDVSECNHFKYEGVNCVIYNTYCWGFDCNYKQRKRKEKECEELKERLNTTCFDPKNNNCRCISYNRIAEDYKADLIKLRKVNSKNMELESHLLFIQNIYNSLYREKKDILMNIDNIIKEFEIESIKDVKTGKIIYRSKKLLKYKSTLDEIENYVRDNSDFDTSDKLTSNTGAYDILEIINEVKE